MKLLFRMLVRLDRGSNRELVSGSVRDLWIYPSFENSNEV